jgi:hypothetical protein
MRRSAHMIAVCAVVVFITTTSSAQRGASGGQWPNHSGDKGSTKYAPLSDQQEQRPESADRLAQAGCG